jgi:hypothetical protein
MSDGRRIQPAGEEARRDNVFNASTLVFMLVNLRRNWFLSRAGSLPTNVGDASAFQLSKICKKRNL